MPPLRDHQSSQTTKILILAHSGSGKTGALASLAAAGYNLRVLDLDNGLDILRSYLTNPDSPYVKAAPDCADRVRFLTLTDSMKSVNGRPVYEKVGAWKKAVDMVFDKWIDGEDNFGKVTTWGPNDILVVDSLTMLARAAMAYHLQMNNALLKVATSNEARRNIGAAQSYVRDFLAALYDKSVVCNVIVTAHITPVDERGAKPRQGTGDGGDGDNGDPGGGGTIYGHPSAIGRALSPEIPRFFNNVLVIKSQGVANGTKRVICTGPQYIDGMVINSKNSSPLSVAKEYGIENGLAEYFKALRK